MRPKYKTTGCARFFFFLIIFVPAVFFGAAYFRGENGVQIIKDFYHNTVGGIFTKGEEKEQDNTKDIYETSDLKKQLEARDREIKKLKDELQEKDKEIEKLKSDQ